MVEGALCAIAALDGRVRAFARLDPDAPCAALQLDAAGAVEPLHGLPIAVKDTIATAGLAIEYGSRLGLRHVPADDAACVHRLKAAGAVVVGKTVTTEFAYLEPGPTRNPWDIGRTPGGSSSGSAAAVAAGMVPLALGSQTGGSVIRPASYCGVFGFKASVGRVDLGGVHELARSLDSLGWFGAGADDLTLLGRVLLDFDGNWPACPSRPRLARLSTPFDARAPGWVHGAIDAVAGDLAAAGAELRTLTLPPEFAAAESLHQRIVAAEAARALAPYAGRLSPRLAAFVARGRTEWASHADALAQMRAMREAFDAVMDGFDALLLPAATGEAPLGLDNTGDAIFSLPFSLMGAPCAALPVTLGPGGMPLGAQFVGRHGADEALLEFAAWASARLLLAPRFAPDGARVARWARAYDDVQRTCREWPAMREVRWERMFPDQLEAAFARCPLLYLPYGMCEPHGPQNALGLDALKAHALCIRAAEVSGGIVAPPDYWHIHEVGFYAAWARSEIGEVPRKWLSAVPPWIHFKNVCYHVRAAEAIGFHAVILLTGHYGPNWEDLKTLVSLLQPYVAARLFGLPDFEANVPGFDNDGQSGGDHAGKVETSLLASLEPACVDMGRLPALPLAPVEPGGAGKYFAMGRDAHRADRRVGDRMVADELVFLTRKADELLAAYEPRRDSRLRTFEDVERFWSDIVQPRLPKFRSMEGYVEPLAEVEAIPANSVWKATSTGPARA